MVRTVSRLGWRVSLVALLLLVAAGFVVGRLVTIQIVRHDYYREQARDEHYGLQVLRAPRGAILDRNGYPLATTVDAYDLYIERRAWQDLTVAEPAAARLAPLVGRSPDELLLDVRDEETGDYPLALGMDFDKGKQIAALGVAGVKAVQTTKRSYPEGDLGSALIGFVGRDHVGLTGLEADLDENLGGIAGTIYFERDSIGNPIAFGQRQGAEPKPGGDVRLTIDRYIQRLIETELDRQLEQHQASGGSIIVMDPKTGAILGIASRPSFRLSQLDLQDPKMDLYRLRAVTDMYEPGSVTKVLTAAAAVDLGLVTPNSTYVDTGSVYVGGYTIANWDYSANGVTTVTQLLQKSLNTGAVWLSSLLGPRNFYDYIARFGFGQPTHVGISGEAAGIVRTSDDPGWSEPDLATNSFGQGIAATPLQVITAVAAIANGGVLMRPYIVQETDGPTGHRVYEPVAVRRVISEATAHTVVDMMNQVVEGVPYHLARVPGYHVAGKTGTTLVSIPTGYDLNSTIASFVGFAPVNDPRMIMLIKIDQPKDDPLGGRVAAPVFGKLAPQILAYLGVKPDGAQLIRQKP